MHRILCCVGLTLFLPGLVAAQDAEPTAVDPLAAEVASLDAEFGKAQADWRAFLAARDEASGGALELTEEEWARDPSRTFADRYLALARKAKGTASGAKVSLQALAMLQGDQEKAGAMLDEVVATYHDSAAMESLASRLVWGHWTYGAPRTRAALAALRTSPHEAVRAEATLSAGAIAMQDGARDEAHTLLDELKAVYPETSAGRRADGYLFELDHLQIGMKAPDFEAVDQDGAAWKLSDHLGKVTVIDFWGFW